MKFLKTLLLVALTLLLLAIVYSIPLIGLSFLIGLSKSWLITFLLLFFGISVMIFQFLPVLLIWLIPKFSPFPSFSKGTIVVFAVYFTFSVLSNTWLDTELNQQGIGILLGLIITALTLGMTLNLVYSMTVDDSMESRLDFLILIGQIIFYVGLAFLSCFLTLKICLIMPSKDYNMFSGLWHGIFAIPNWVLSWFLDDHYCKAPSQTFAYSIFWWIGLIFFGQGFFGISRRLF